MFYRTQIKSVTNDGVIDVQGKSLKFIGYLRVKAGDNVFTDGKIVFGHTPIRGSTLLESTPSGIPVLGDYDSQGDELRGYFDKRGHYKRYNIAGDDWIVNDKKIYAHDNGEDNIIDAEIATDGGVYTVEKKVGDIEDYNGRDVLFYYYTVNYYGHHERQRYWTMMELDRASRGNWTNQTRYHLWWVMTDSATCDLVRDQAPIVVQGTYTLDTQTECQITYRTDDAIFRECLLTIKKDGREIETLKLSKLVEPVEQAAMDYVNIVVEGREYHDYITSRANLLNFKIMPDGKWTALVLIEIGAERDYPHLEDNRYEYTAGTPGNSLNVLGYSSAAAHSIFLIKIDSNGNVQKVAEKSEFLPLFLISNIRENAVITTTPTMDAGAEYDIPYPFTYNPTTFPYENYHLISSSFIWVEDGKTVYHEYGWDLYTVWDSRLMTGAPDYDNGVEDFADDFSFPVQDSYQVRITNQGRDINKWILAGVFEDDTLLFGTSNISIDNIQTRNFSLVPLKGGGYLFGIRDNELYKVNNQGNLEQVGDGLKNFRLRELKRISKAKK